MTKDATPDLSGFTSELAEAHAALAALTNPSERAADDIAKSFERAGIRIARALARAAVDGGVSVKQLAKTILEELAKVALDAWLPSGTKSGKNGKYFGARAAGGAVTAGGAYLVGERGPEMFVPNGSGQIAPAASAPVSVHFHLGAGADAQSLMRHQGQIAASVARAIAYGRRNL